jgi:hypothetical protein
MDTSPELKRIDQVPACGIAVEQTLVVLLEAAGRVFSVLVSSRVSAEPDGGAIRLEDCTRLRREAGGKVRSRGFRQVEIVWDPAVKHWIASPDGFQSVFSQPSAEPYAVVQLPELTSRALRGAIQKGDAAGALMMMRVRFKELPGFYSPRPGRLHAPWDYAAGSEAVGLRYEVME